MVLKDQVNFGRLGTCEICRYCSFDGRYYQCEKIGRLPYDDRTTNNEYSSSEYGCDLFEVEETYSHTNLQPHLLNREDYLRKHFWIAHSVIYERGYNDGIKAAKDKLEESIKQLGNKE